MQRLPQFRQLSGVVLNQLLVALHLIGAPAQLLHQQGLDAGKAQLSPIRIVVVSAQGFKGISVALLPLDQLTATAGHHPTGVLHCCRSYHQTHGLQIAQPLLVGQEFGVSGGGATGHGGKKWVLTLNGELTY